jgi:hypothetical protein
LFQNRARLAHSQLVLEQAQIIEDIQTSDEALEGEPERIRFKTPEEIDAL